MPTGRSFFWLYLPFNIMDRSALRRFVLYVVPLVGVALVIASLALAQREPVPTQPGNMEKPIVDPNSVGGSADGKEGKDVVKKRIREGTALIDKRVFFRQTGSRTTLYTLDENERYVCLENLNLQRILQAIEEKPERSVWRIDATFTEFRNENYVLITRAVIAPDDFSPVKPENQPLSKTP